MCTFLKSLMMSTVLLMSVTVQAQQKIEIPPADAYPDAYEQLQNCFANAADVIDNGSYERFCMEQYAAATQHQAQQ